MGFVKVVSLFCLLVISSSGFSAATLPSLEPVFTLEVVLGTPLDPIDVPGGVLVVEPFTGGNVTGSAVNGTIKGGQAYPSELMFPNNVTSRVASVVIYGTTTPDGLPWLVTVSGIGAETGQLARADIRIGGKYSYLQESYILAELVPASNDKSATVSAYLASF